MWRKTDTDVAPASDSYAWLSQPYFGEATAAQTVPSTYTPGVGGALWQTSMRSLQIIRTPISSPCRLATAAHQTSSSTPPSSIWTGGKCQFCGHAQCGRRHVQRVAIAATGTFSGPLSRRNGDFLGVVDRGAVNAVDTINIAGDAVVLASAALGGSDASVSITVPICGRSALIVWFSGKPLMTSQPPVVVLKLDGTEVSRASGGLYTEFGSINTDASGLPLSTLPRVSHAACPATTSNGDRTATSVKVASLLGKDDD